MANDILQMMSKQVMNNVINNNPIMNLMSMARGGANPQAMLQLINQQNPQLANQINQLLNSGKSQQEIIGSLLQNKSPLELQNMKNAMSQMGLPQNEINKYIK